jgi:hypothetical protein
MFGERPFVDCIEKVDSNFVVGFGSCFVEMLWRVVPFLLDYILYPQKF